MPSRVKTTRRHSTLYFSDGDVVLSVDSANGIQHLFRVDTVFLSRHSTVFADILSIPSSPAANETYDGVSLVRLVDDDAEGVEDFLKFMYNPASLMFGKMDSETPIRAMRVLKVAKKYDVVSIKPLVVQQLKSDWPTNLAEWIRLEVDKREFKTAYDGNESPILDDMYPEPASAIKIALDHHIPEILPAAFYALAQIDFQDDWTRWHEGEWPYYKEYLDGNVDDPLYDGGRTARWSLLDRETLFCLLLGRRTLLDRAQNLCSIIRRTTPPRCTSPIDCSKIRQRDWDSMHTHTTTATYSQHPDPLGTLRKWLSPVEHMETFGQLDLGLCSQCSDATRRTLREEMGKIWDDLVPDIFRVDTI